MENGKEEGELEGIRRERAFYRGMKEQDNGFGQVGMTERHLGYLRPSGQ